MTRCTPLRASRVKERLPDHRFTRDLRIMGVISSTSDLLLEQARAGAADGVVMTAEEQTRGRGRRGAGWRCPSGKGLLFSAIVRQSLPDLQRALLSACVGVALCRCLREQGLDAGVKWPNDVLVAETKVAGCLVDLGEDFAVLGIGVNANQHAAELPRDAPLPAASMALLLGRQVDREQLLADLLRHLDLALQDLTQDRSDEIVAAFLGMDRLAGAEVAVREGDRVIEGVALEAHPIKGLLVRAASGEEERLRPAHSHVLRVQFPTS